MPAFRAGAPRYPGSLDGLLAELADRQSCSSLLHERRPAARAAG